MAQHVKGADLHQLLHLPDVVLQNGVGPLGVGAGLGIGENTDASQVQAHGVEGADDKVQLGKVQTGLDGGGVHGAVAQLDAHPYLHPVGPVVFERCPLIQYGIKVIVSGKAFPSLI